MSKAARSKILTAARFVFLRYGYRRVSMNEIAEAAGMSRAAIYLAFKNKDDVFIGVILQWIDETIADIESEIARLATSAEKLSNAFELWAVHPFEMTLNSPEAKELVECSFEFAQPAIRQGYKRFEAAIVPILASHAEWHAAKISMNPERTAHVLASAVHGFKQVATTPAELRALIEDLLALSLHVTPLKTEASGAPSRARSKHP